jgi:hypothetical protein
MVMRPTDPCHLVVSARGKTCYQGHRFQEGVAVFVACLAMAVSL